MDVRCTHLYSEFVNSKLNIEFNAIVIHLDFRMIISLDKT